MQNEDCINLVALSTDLKSAVPRLMSVAAHGGLNESVRASAWRLFLRVVPPGAPEKWASVVAAQRERYRALKEAALANLAEAMAQAILEHDEDEDDAAAVAPRHRDEFAAVEEAADQIRGDLERCYPEGAGAHFLEASRQSLMFGVLLVWSHQHQPLGYRQGMHELLAPLVWAMERSADASATVCLPPDNALDALLVDPKFIEHDVYWLFDALMELMQQLYAAPGEAVIVAPVVDAAPVEADAAPASADAATAPGARSTDGPDSRKQRFAVSPVVAMCARVQDERLRGVDVELHAHLSQAVGRDVVLPQVYMLSWLRLAFGRQFAIDDLVRVWDAFFSTAKHEAHLDPDRTALFPTMVDWLEATATLLLIVERQNLLASDSMGCMQLLLRCVAPEPLWTTTQARRLHNDPSVAEPLIAALRQQASLGSILPTWAISFLSSIGVVAQTPSKSAQHDARDDSSYAGGLFRQVLCVTSPASVEN